MSKNTTNKVSFDDKTHSKKDKINCTDCFGPKKQTYEERIDRGKRRVNRPGDLKDKHDEIGERYFALAFNNCINQDRKKGQGSRRSSSSTKDQSSKDHLKLTTSRLKKSPSKSTRSNRPKIKQ